MSGERLWITPEPAGEPFRVPIESVRLPRNVSAGCNFLVLGALAHKMRGGTEDPDPILVDQEADGSWRICDGRHRYLAAVIAGRPDVLCIRVPAVPDVPIANPQVIA